MSTLLISEVFPPRTGGSGRWFWEIYRRMPRAEFLIAAGHTPGWEDFDHTHDLRVTRLPLTLSSWGVVRPRDLFRYWRIVRQLRRLVKAGGVRRIHCGRCLPEGLMALALKCRTGIPYACYVHGEDMTLATTSRELAWLTRRVVNNADFFIANSRNTERILREDWQIHAARVHVLHPGVDTARFVPTGRSVEVRARLGWGQRRVVLTVGRLQMRKGQDQMIRALRTIRQAVPDVLYAIVGDGEERAALGELTAREGLQEHVQFLGEIGDGGLLECYQQCDLFALPNRQVGQDIEGFGMVLLEAQACGKPVIAGASGGTAETMVIAETGRVVPCDEPHELAALVIDLLADPKRLAGMGAAGRRWVVERFDWESLSQQARRLFGHPEAGPSPPACGNGQPAEGSAATQGDRLCQTADV